MKCMLISLLATLLFFCGCGSRAKEQQQRALGEAQSIAQACDEKSRTGEIQTRVARVECARPTLQLLEQSGFPHMDIVQLIFAHQMVLVKRLDEGKISIEEAKLSIAELNTRITTEVQKRDMQASQAKSLRMIGWGALLQGSRSR